jgi:hypothetical protein
VIDIHSAFSQHLLQLTVTDAVFAVPAYGPQNDVTLKMPAFEWVHVQLHQQKGMISLSPPTICNSASFRPQPEPTLMGSWAIGQALLNIAPADVTLFLIVSLLISAAVVPITLLPSHPPAQVEQEWVAFRDLVLVSPLAAAGAFLAGLAIGGFWGMGANFAQSIGLDVGGISAFMAAVLGGTLAFHWPLGWLSDRVPRNLVIAGAALASAASAIGVALAVEAPLPLLLAAGALFGGFGIPIYSLCLAVANDDLPAGRLLGTARGLLLLNGIGTAAGP